MLLNISNHPSVRWSAEQTAAALKQYGDIQDLDFPAVDPDASTEEVCCLAHQLAQSVFEIGTPDDVAVHLMGEMTLTYELVNLLKAAGYTCVASTSYREVYEEVPGKKTIIFKFVRFREY